MTEVRDPAIKLFGKTIPVWESQISSEDGDKSYPECQISSDSDEMDVCREIKKEEFDGLSKKYLNDVKEDNQTPTQESKETTDPKLDEDQAGTDMDDQEKTLKKPDKIIPCPRCNSLDTKFCYYNNYNVSQPRHFCKNCQRYWTAGGTMRNVPVGAGRRKNKHAASQYRHIMMSPEGISTTRVETSDSANHQSLSSARLATPLRSLDGNRTVLKFGPDAPLSESMDTVLNLGDQKRNVELGSVACGENGEEPSSCGSSVSASACGEIKFPENVPQMEHGGNCNGFIPTHPLQPYSGPPWGYAWNPSWNNMTAMGAGRCSSDLVYGPDSSNSNPVQWGSPPMVAAPGFYASSMPFPMLPGSYWGCMPSYVPWVGSNGNLYPAFTTSKSSCSGNDSPTLGKHSRDANIQGEKKPEKSLWAPKTLRIDDPDEAAKSSIWATLGIRPDQTEPFKRNGIFRAFQPRTEGKDHHTSDAAHVLHANPAALSRSQTFQEST